MMIFGKRQIAVVGTLMALAFSAGLAQSALAGATDTPAAATRTVVAGDQLATLQRTGALEKRGYLEAAAAYLDMTVDELRAALKTGKSLAEIAVEQGFTREGLIDALAEVAREQIGTLIDRKADPDARKDKPARPEKPNKPERPDKPVPPGQLVKIAVEAFKVAIDYLGLDRGVLMERVRKGETLAEIAEDTDGKSRAGLIKAIVDAANAQIDQAVANGRITAERAAALKEGQEERAESLVDADPPAFPKASPGKGSGKEKGAEKGKRP